MKDKLRILAVDDDPEMRAAILNSLADRYDVLTADAADEIDEALESFEPELIVLDVMMPGEDGLHALQRLRGSHKADATPILMLTGVPEDRYFSRASTSGADGWLAKPFTPQQLRKAVTRTIAQSR